MSVSAVKNTRDEYEDDFERDLDWLISEESKSEEQDTDNYDTEAQIDKELEEEEFTEGKKKEVHKVRDLEDDDEEEERWPTPMEPLEGVLDSDEDNLVASSQLNNDENLDEEKRYILDKIQEANRQLQDQEPPDQSRRRRLQFKDTLVDLVVPAQEFEAQENNSALCGDSEEEGEVTGHIQNLKISPREESESGDHENEKKEGSREGRVLVEKDGKFDLVSLKEVESHGLLPPLATPHGDHQQGSSRQNESGLHVSKSPVSSPRQSSTSPFPLGIESLYVPKPPAKHRNRPSSARPSQRGTWVQGTKRRVQSANGSSSHGTFTLSPQQKELLVKLQERRDRQAKEEEQKRKEEEEQKRQENELAFQSWLMRKREQLYDERRVQKAQEMERMSCKHRDNGDPEEAFKNWLQKKQEQQMKEKQLEDMKRLEEESGFSPHSREDSEKAFKHWLKRKHAEKRAEQQAARERSRRLVLEERRARRMRDLLCTVNEIKPFRFSEPHGYRY